MSLPAPPQVSVAVTEPAETVPREAPAPSYARLLEPAELIDGTYKIAGSVGAGAMGVVYLAVDMRLARTVALKLIRESLVSPGFRALFQQEARIMAQVNHPNVVTIYSFGEHQRIPYFAMEFVQGESLHRLIQKQPGKMELELAFSLVDQACAGLSAIHATGAIHRDIKPANLLVDQQRRLRIGDLGLATAYGDGSSRPEVVGTPGYMAPEIMRGDGEATPQSDLFALAGVTFELLVGRPLFRTPPEHAHEVEHAYDPAHPPSVERPGLPAAVDAVLAAALNPDPQQRPATVEVFRRALLHAAARVTDPARILLVEDDRDERALMKLALEAEFPSAVVDCAVDGHEALIAFDRKPASVVVSDLQMPRTDGLTLTASLRCRPQAKQVPIILLTASGGPADWRRLHSLGADGFVVKPANVDDLAAMIRRTLRERRAAQS